MRVILTVLLLLVALLPLRSAPPAPMKITQQRDFLQHLQWSPDGKRFLFTRIHAGKMGLWTCNVDGSDLKLLSAAISMPHFDGSWSPDSSKVTFVFDRLQGTDGKLQIDVINHDGSAHGNIIPHKAFEESPRWSPNGKQLAWVSTRDRSQDIWVASADGKDLKRLTSDAAADNNPAWSPDGKQLAFCSARSGNFDIYVMNSDGANVRRLTTHPRMDYWPAWSPDGSTIAFTSNRDGNYDIYLMSTDGTNQRNLTQHPANDNYAAWSPDSRRLAFISNRSGGYNIHIVAVK